MSIATVSSVRASNWSGKIPIVISLAPTSLSSPTMPPSIHVMISRQTYLHIGLQHAVMRLYKFAPAMVSFKNMTIRSEPDPGDDSDDGSAENSNSRHTQSTATESSSTTEDYPVCWFEDEDTEVALRWHMFAGTLLDLKYKRDQPSLPWKIRLHFSGYPTSQLLPLDSVDGVLTIVERTFRNSIKQALFLQYGSSRVAMGMTKKSHEQIWDSIVSSNYQLYQQVNSDLQAGAFDTNGEDQPQLLPVRLIVDSKPPIQRPCRHSSSLAGKKSESLEQNLNTLGSLLTNWVPQFFHSSLDGSVQPESRKTLWLVQGIQVPLCSNLVDLWKCLCHPDHFLYIVITTRC